MAERSLWGQGAPAPGKSWPSSSKTLPCVSAPNLCMLTGSTSLILLRRTSGGSRANGPHVARRKGNKDAVSTLCACAHTLPVLAEAVSAYLLMTAKIPPRSVLRHRRGREGRRELSPVGPPRTGRMDPGQEVSQRHNTVQHSTHHKDSEPQRGWSLAAFSYLRG